ncbi:interleukin-36 receptor antagonist protein-like isoform X1 [Columba livia]|uniref:interleukin-36 receptor antagonist protein-like isoform X1 n=1 Tax=Columba livia TaxID=8932 RepID=UPI0031BAFFFA
MSRVPRAATRGCIRDKGPQGHLGQSQLLRDPPGIMVGTGDAAESVIDPDMVALFNDFLGEAVLTGSTIASTESHVVAQPYHYVVRDTEQKGLCLHDGHLVATSFQGTNAAQEEPISVVPNPSLERWRCPLIVGIRGGKQALSCGTGPEPQLKLEEVGLLDLFSRPADATPYTFYKTFGGTTHTFESAAFPGLFLSTSPGPALGLAAPPDVTAFYLLRK